MNRKAMYTNRLTDRGDLVRMEVAPDGHVEMPKERHVDKQDATTSPSSPPKFPPPPAPLQIRYAPTVPEKDKQPTPVQIPSQQRNGHSAQSLETTPKLGAASDKAAPMPRLKLYADVDVKALEKNPIHNDIMNAAEKFKDRRDVNSPAETNSKQTGDAVQVKYYVKSSNGARHPVFDPDEMRKRKEHPSPPANSEMKWSQPKPLVKRNTYTVIPNSQMATLVGNAQAAMKAPPQRSASVADGLGYTKIEDVPEADALLDIIATHDEKGKAIPEWKRKLLAHNYRVKLCKQFES